MHLVSLDSTGVQNHCITIPYFKASLILNPGGTSSWGGGGEVPGSLPLYETLHMYTHMHSSSIVQYRLEPNVT